MAIIFHRRFSIMQGGKQALMPGPNGYRTTASGKPLTYQKKPQTTRVHPGVHQRWLSPKLDIRDGSISHDRAPLFGRADQMLCSDQSVDTVATQSLTGTNQTHTVETLCNALRESLIDGVSYRRRKGYHIEDVQKSFKDLNLRELWNQFKDGFQKPARVVMSLSYIGDDVMALTINPITEALSIAPQVSNTYFTFYPDGRIEVQIPPQKQKPQNLLPILFYHPDVTLVGKALENAVACVLEDELFKGYERSKHGWPAIPREVIDERIQTFDFFSFWNKMKQAQTGLNHVSVVFCRNHKRATDPDYIGLSIKTLDDRFPQTTGYYVFGWICFNNNDVTVKAVWDLSASNKNAKAFIPQLQSNKSLTITNSVLEDLIPAERAIPTVDPRAGLSLVEIFETSSIALDESELIELATHYFKNKVFKEVGGEPLESLSREDWLLWFSRVSFSSEWNKMCGLRPALNELNLVVAFWHRKKGIYAFDLRKESDKLPRTESCFFIHLNFTKGAQKVLVKNIWDNSIQQKFPAKLFDACANNTDLALSQKLEDKFAPVEPEVIEEVPEPEPEPVPVSVPEPEPQIPVLYDSSISLSAAELRHEYLNHVFEKLNSYLEQFGEKGLSLEKALFAKRLHDFFLQEDFADLFKVRPKAKRINFVFVIKINADGYRVTQVLSTNESLPTSPRYAFVYFQWQSSAFKIEKIEDSTVKKPIAIELAQTLRHHTQFEISLLVDPYIQGRLIEDIENPDIKIPTKDLKQAAIDFLNRRYQEFSGPKRVYAEDFWDMWCQFPFLYYWERLQALRPELKKLDLVVGHNFNKNKVGASDFQSVNDAIAIKFNSVFFRFIFSKEGIHVVAVWDYTEDQILPQSMLELVLSHPDLHEHPKLRSETSPIPDDIRFFPTSDHGFGTDFENTSLALTGPDLIESACVYLTERFMAGKPKRGAGWLRLSFLEFSMRWKQAPFADMWDQMKALRPGLDTLTVSFFVYKQAGSIQIKFIPTSQDLPTTSGYYFGRMRFDDDGIELEKVWDNNSRYATFAISLAKVLSDHSDLEVGSMVEPLLDGRTLSALEDLDYEIDESDLDEAVADYFDFVFHKGIEPVNTGFQQVSIDEIEQRLIDFDFKSHWERVQALRPHLTGCTLIGKLFIFNAPSQVSLRFTTADSDCSETGNYTYFRINFNEHGVSVGRIWDNKSGDVGPHLLLQTLARNSSLRIPPELMGVIDFKKLPATSLTKYYTLHDRRDPALLSDKSVKLEGDDLYEAALGYLDCAFFGSARPKIGRSPVWVDDLNQMAREVDYETIWRTITSLRPDLKEFKVNVSILSADETHKSLIFRSMQEELPTSEGYSFATISFGFDSSGQSMIRVTRIWGNDVGLNRLSYIKNLFECNESLSIDKNATLEIIEKERKEREQAERRRREKELEEKERQEKEKRKRQKRAERRRREKELEENTLAEQKRKDKERKKKERQEIAERRRREKELEEKERQEKEKRKRQKRAERRRREKELEENTLAEQKRKDKERKKKERQEIAERKRREKERKGKERQDRTERKRQEKELREKRRQEQAERRRKEREERERKRRESKLAERKIKERVKLDKNLSDEEVSYKKMTYEEKMLVLRRSFMAGFMEGVEKRRSGYSAISFQDLISRLKTTDFAELWESLSKKHSVPFNKFQFALLFIVRSGEVSVSIQKHDYELPSFGSLACIQVVCNEHGVFANHFEDNLENDLYIAPIRQAVQKNKTIK